MKNILIKTEIGRSRRVPFYKRAILQGCRLELITEDSYRNNEDDFEYSITGQAKVSPNTILTFFAAAGEFAGTDIADFWIVKVNPRKRERKLSSGSHYYLKGRFEILAHGKGEEAFCLQKWWVKWAIGNGGQTEFMAQWLGRHIGKGLDFPPPLPETTPTFKPIDGWNLDGLDLEKSGSKKKPPEPLGTDIQQPDKNDVWAHFTKLYYMWRHEGIFPLNGIKGHSKLLLDGELGDLGDRQRRAIEIINKSSGIAIHKWDYPTNYLLLYEKEIEFEPVSLFLEIEEALDYLGEVFLLDKVNISYTGDIPRVKASGWISTALIDLIIGGQILYSASFIPKIRVTFDEGSVVEIEVEVGSSKSRETEIIETVSEPGTYLNIANMIIEKHNGKLEMSVSDRSITFQFALPVWFNTNVRQQRAT